MAVLQKCDVELPCLHKPTYSMTLSNLLSINGLFEEHIDNKPESINKNIKKPSPLDRHDYLAE
jgi:hypothetical protein